jgi:hypothetical protein
MRRNDQAVAEAERALRIDPISTGLKGNLGSVLSSLTSATRRLSTAIDLDHGYWFNYCFLGRAYVQKGRLPEAMRLQPRTVPLKLLKPIIENATIEDDDDLRDIWANLLVSGAGAHEEDGVTPSFPAILKDLCSGDAKFLDAFFRKPPRNLRQTAGHSSKSGNNGIPL